MPAPTALIWDSSLTAYRFGADHPFNPLRLELATSLMEAFGLLSAPQVSVLPPRDATDEELFRVHHPDYVAAVRRLGASGPGRGAGLPWGLGTPDNPIFPAMHQATARVVGGTLQAAELVMEGKARRAFSIAGGLHHGHRDRASGFCVYNDLAVAIAAIREQYGARVMYIDYDAHHGDGVQWIFYRDPAVLTVSIHESGRYLFPGTGFVDELGEGAGLGRSLNLPLLPGTEDDGWLPLQHELLTEAAEAFRPEVIVLQNGCDGHRRDPLTHLAASTRLYEETPLLVRELADRFCEGRLIATGGGGYAIWHVVPRAWTLVWAALSEQDAPDQIPTEWLQQWEPRSPEPLPRRLRDETVNATDPRAAGIGTRNAATLYELRRRALPLLGKS